MAFLRASNYFFEVSKGNVPGHLDYSAHGINDDVDTAAAEDVFTSGGIFTPPTTFRVHNIASSSANDTSAGTGARTIRIHGVTSSGLEEEVITMNGVSNVATTKAYQDIYRMYIVTTGSGLTNAGTITATAQTDATVTITIGVNGFNAARRAIRYIPTGYTGYILDFTAGMQQNVASTSADVNLLIKYPSETWQTVAYIGLINTGSSAQTLDLKIPRVLPAGSWVKAQCTSVSNNNTKIKADFNLIIVAD